MLNFNKLQRVQCHLGPMGASSTRFLGRFPYRVDGPPTGAHIPADSVLDEGVAQPLAGNSARRRSSR